MLMVLSMIGIPVVNDDQHYLLWVRGLFVISCVEDYSHNNTIGYYMVFSMVNIIYKWSQHSSTDDHVVMVVLMINNANDFCSRIGDTHSIGSCRIEIIDISDQW